MKKIKRRNARKKKNEGETMRMPYLLEDKATDHSCLILGPHNKHISDGRVGDPLIINCEKKKKKEKQKKKKKKPPFKIIENKFRGKNQPGENEHYEQGSFTNTTACRPRQ
jgi:hypothetical protein